MKQILITIVFLAALPLFASTHGQSGSVAFAGHTLSGGWCQCGCPGCICDPGEEVEMCIPGVKEAHDAITQPTPHSRSDNSSGTTAAMLVGAAGLLWRRFRR